MYKTNVISSLSKNFALRIIFLYRYLTEERHEYIMSKQLCRSGTSIGANIAESKNAQSTADFISKLSISLKYWLELLKDSDTITQEEFDSVSNDLKTIIGTLVNIINKLKEKEKLKKW